MATTGQDGGGTVYIRPVVSADGVAAGVDEIKREFASIPGAADQATKATNKSLSSLGAGGGKGLDEVSAATQRAVKQIERLNLEIESGGRNTAAYIAGRAKLAGADVDALAPLIAQNEKLRAVQALANAEFTKSGKALDQFGMSAKQTTAALRQVPAQFTDIVVSLQGGQAPLTVLLQQGGQLKDIFGSAGGAAKALGGYVLGLVNPFTVAAAAVGGVATAYYLGSKESDEFRKSLALSGNQVGLTVGGLADMAKNMGSVSGATGAAASALSAFAAAGAVGAAGIQKATEAAMALEKYGGQAVAETAKQFKSLGDDPLKASIKLNDAVNFLTTSLYEQIKALEEQGRTIEAAALAQDAFANAAKSNAGEIQANLGTIERGWIGIKSAILEAVDAAKGIGRPETIGAQIAAKQALVNQYQKNGYDTTKEQGELDALNRRALREQDIATNKAQQKLETENLIAANKILDGFMSKQEKMGREILASRTALVRAGIDQATIETTIAAIREKYKEKSAPKEAITDAQRALASYIEGLQKRIDKEEELTEVQKAQNLLASLGTTGQIAQVRELVLGRAALVDAQVAETAAAKESAKALEEKSKALDKWYDLRVKDSADLDSQISKRQKEVDAIGETAEAIGELTAAKYDEAAANKESYAAALQNASAYAGEFKDAYLNAAQDARDQAAKLRELSRLSTLEGTKKASVEAAKEAAKAWQKGWEETDRLARDVFVTWAEDGSNAAKKIGDTLKKALLSAIYEATIKPVAFQIYSSATSALGLPGSSGSGGGLLKNASDAYGLYDKASSFFGGGGASSAFGFAGMAGAGTAAGATAVLPAVTTAAIEAGITATGGSIFSLAAPSAVGATIPVAGGVLSAGGLVASAPAVTAPLAAGAAPALGIPGIGWAIGGALLLAGLLGGGGGRYVKSTGETSLNFDESGKETYRAPYRFQGMDEATAKEYGMKYVDLNEGANNFATSLNKTYLSAAKSLGITAAASNFAYGGNDADSSTGQGKFRLGAGVVGGKSYFNSGEIAKSDEALKLAASRAVLTALSGSEMPKYLAGVFDSVGDIATNSQAQIDAVLSTAQSFKALHDSLDQLPFDNLKDQTYAVYKALTDAAGGLEQFGQKLSGYYDNFYSAEEKRTQTLKGISKRLADGGINVGVDALEKMSRADFRALFETIQTTFTGQASTGMVAALLDVQGAFASVTAASADAATALASTRKALLDAATGAASAALSGLTKSVEAQKTALTSAYDLQVGNFTDQLTNVTTSVSKLQSLASSLKGTLDGLRIAGSDGQYRSAAQAQISTALATARSGGGLPLDGQLTNALQTVSRPSEQLFATFTDYARDFYKTANDIAALGDLTGEQLSADEAMQGLLQDQLDLAKRSYDAQVSGLDAIATLAQSQLDAANGTWAAMLSLSDAIKASTAATQDLLNARGQQGLTTGAVVGGGLQSVKPDVARLDSINTYVNTLDFSESGAANSVQQLYAAAQQYGVNQSELAAATGYRLEDVQKLFTKYGIPAFAVGTNYIPNDMVAMLHEGEAVVPKAYNPAAGGDSNSALLDEMRAMRAEIAALRASAADTADNTKRTASTLVNVTRGGEAMQTQVFA